MAASNLTAARLRELLLYDPLTGIFTSRIDRVGKGCKTKAGDLVGGPHNRGYWAIRLDGCLYLAHRLAWLYVHGEWPSKTLDHRDRDKRNNRIGNLRDAGQGVNSQNRGGVAGITYSARDKRWIAQLTADGVLHQIRCRTKNEAVIARADLKTRLHAPVDAY